jgi:hypothetical protein
VNIAASAATVTVAGTVDLGATDNAVLDAIAASVAAIDTDATTIIGHVDGIEGILTTIDADTGGILTAVQIIDNAISGNEMQVDVVAALPAGTNNIGDVDVLTVPTDPFGATADAAVTAGATGSISAKLRSISRDLVANIVLAAGTNAIGKLAANSGVDIGDVDVTSISAGTNAIGNVGLIGRTTGGLSIFRSLDIDETEEEVKATAGQLFSIHAMNTTNAALYLKFYNATAANVSVGSTTPVLTFIVPGNNDTDGAGFVWNNDIGFAFGTAITVACTTALADADTGAPGANACVINLGYV